MIFRYSVPQAEVSLWQFFFIRINDLATRLRRRHVAGVQYSDLKR